MDREGTGFFGKYNLDPQLIFIIAGRAAQAILSGDIKIGTIGATRVAMPLLRMET